MWSIHRLEVAIKCARSACRLLVMGSGAVLFIGLVKRKYNKQELNYTTIEGRCSKYAEKCRVAQGGAIKGREVLSSNRSLFGIFGNVCRVILLIQNAEKMGGVIGN